MKGIKFEIGIKDKVTSVLQKVNTKVTLINNLFKKTKSTIKTVPNSISGLNQKLSVLREKQSKAFTVQGIKHYRREIEKTEKELKKLNQVASGGGGLKKMFSGIGGKIAGVGAAYVGVNGILNGVSSTFKAVGAYEQLSVAFETMLGSTNKAKTVISDLTKFSNVTPFEPEQVNRAGKSLLAFGFSSEQLIPTLQKIGDISAGTGKDFNELTTIYGKAKIAGTLYAEDINQLLEAGIPILDEFAQQLGVDASEIKKMASNGQISFDMLEKAFTNLTVKGGKFGGLMEAQSKTLAGRWSTLVGKFDELKIKIGEALMPVFNVFIKYAFKGVNYLTEVFRGVSAAINGTKTKTEEMGSVMRKAFSVVSFIKENINAIKTLAAVVGTVIAGIKIWTGVQWLLNAVMIANPIGAIVVGITALIAGIVAAWKYSEKFRGVILGLWESMKLLGDILKTIIIDRIKLMAKGIGEIATALEHLSKGNFKEAWISLKQGSADYFGVTTVKDAVDKSKGFSNSFKVGMDKARERHKVTRATNVLDGNSSGNAVDKQVPASTANNLPQLPNVGTGLSPDTLPAIPQGNSPQIVGDIQSSGVKNFVVNIDGVIKDVHNYFRDTDTIEDADGFMNKLSNALMSVFNDVNHGM